MHITDDLDRDKTIKPTIDTEADLDAPYIDFEYAENKEEIVAPENGIWDTLFYEKTKIFIVNEVSETEVSEGTVLADGPACDHGELALGRNM